MLQTQRLVYVAGMQLSSEEVKLWCYAVWNTGEAQQLNWEAVLTLCKLRHASMLLLPLPEVTPSRGFNLERNAWLLTKELCATLIWSNLTNIRRINCVSAVVCNVI